MNRLYALAMLCATVLLPAPAWAIENFTWSTPTGLLFFGAGILPPHTDYGSVGLRTIGASANGLYDQSGHKVVNQFNLSVNVTTPSYIYMTDKQIFGANWGVLIAQPIFTLNGGLHVPTPFGDIGLHDSTTGLGNTALEPFLLQWVLPHNLFINTGVLIQPADGQYSKSSLFNPATNYWTFGPHAAVTWISPYGQEVSAYSELDFNTTNPATHYHTGTELKIEWAIGQHLGDFTVGPAGYIYQQVENDSGPTVNGTVRSRVFAAGLSVNYFHRGSPFIIQATVTTEFGAVSHLQGTSGALRMGFSF